MGVIRVEISMSQPANVIYTHKKFKRTSSQCWKEGSAESAALPCSVAEGSQHTAEALQDEGNPWAAQERDGAESLLFAASLVEQRDAGERLQRFASSEACVINGTSSDALHFSSADPIRGVWSCSYCKFSTTHEDEVRLHEAQHSRFCSNCRAPEVSCYCEQLSARQSRLPSSSLGTLPATNCQLTTSNYQLQQPGKHQLPADLSVISTKVSNNIIYPSDGYSQRELYSLHTGTEVTAVGKTIYKPKFRASYSLDDSSSATSCSYTTSSYDDVFEAAEPKHSVAIPYNSVSTSSDLKSTISLPRHVASLPSVKGDEPGTALRLGSIMGTGLWKGIKSPSPDLGEHIDKLIDQNKLIMDSDNPLRNRKYRRQSSIGGSSSSENENSSGVRSRRTSATDSVKCKASAIATQSNRARVQTLVDVPAGQASAAVPPETHGSIAYKRNVSALGQCSGHPSPKFSGAAQIVPSSHFTPADLKRFLSADNSSSAQTAVPLVPSSSLDREVYVQQILSNPDPEAHKLLVARGTTHGLQRTSIIPVVNPQVLILVCPNCSASFRTRESLEVHLDRHCSGKVDNFSSEHNPSLCRAYLVNKNGPLQDSAIDLQKRGEIRDFSPAQMRSSSVENEPRGKNLIDETIQSRGSSLGAEVRLNVDHIKPSFRSTSPYSRQQLGDVSLPPNKKRKLSSETRPSEDFSVTSVHPVLVHNGVVFQRARVSVKAVADSKRPATNKHQLCGGEVKICDGTEYKTMRIDTSDCSRNFALDMCLTSAVGPEVKLEHNESRSPTSHNIVTLSKSGLNCGGTMVESRVSCLATSSSVSHATRRDSSDTGDLQSNFVNPKTQLKFSGKDMDLPSISLSNLQQYAPQLQLPNLSIPGVPIPNISGVMLSKLSSSQPSIMNLKRNSSFSEHPRTSTNYSYSSVNSNGKTSYKYLADPALISVGKEKVPYVPGIPGPYSQPSPNLAMNTSLTSTKSEPIFSTMPLTSFKPEQSNHEKSLSDPSSVLSNVSAPKNSLFGSTKVDLPCASSLPLVSSEQQPALEKLSVSVTAADLKDIFLAPRKRPDTLPLKPYQFVSKSTAQLIGSTIMSPDTPRPKKSCAQLLLDGSAYTYLGLKVSTKTYYCCIYRPQPMYVPQSPDSKISMYSNWQIRKPAEDNPFNLSISESMGLYSSRRYTDSAYSVAKPTTNLIYTYSNDKIIEAFAHIRKQEKSESAFLSLSASEKKLSSGGSPCRPSKIVEGVADIKIEELKTSTHVTASNSSREPSDDSRLSSTSSRIRICDGGFKSTEEYTYVRGRGRGRYVCETCGIRCKKPSMLKKHIRTHTNFRPYPCTLCTSRFKTKGNLTKHLKSKAHYKKCLQHGLPHEHLTGGGDDASADIDFDEDDDEDDDEDGDEDDEDDDDECDDDARESRENSSMRDSSRENSYFRDSSRENSYVNESREGSCFRDSRENSYIRESRENSFLGESGENCYVRDSRENSYIQDSRENSYVGESRENSCIPDSRENSCIRDGSLENNLLSGNSGCSGSFEKCKEDTSSLCLSSASSVMLGRSQKFLQVEDAGMDLRVSSVACRNVPHVEITPTAAVDDAPIDLSIKKSFQDPAPKSDHGLFSSLLSRGPTDILSPVTESSMLLKSIYNTTERASRASSVLHNQASFAGPIPNSQASGVMMKAYLTERAIQETFIKRHQYQGPVSFADATRDTGLPTTTLEPVIITKIIPKVEQMRLASESDIAIRNSILNVPDGVQSTQASSLVKPKSYYCSKLPGAGLPISSSYSAQPSDVIQVSSKPLANQQFPSCPVSVVAAAPSFELSKSSCSTTFTSHRSLDGVLVDDATFKGKLRAAFDLVEASDKRRASFIDDPCEYKDFADSSGKFFKSASTLVVNVTVGVPYAMPKKAHIMAASRIAMSPTTTLGTSQLTVASNATISHVPITHLSSQDSLSVSESIQNPNFSSHSVDSSRVDILSNPDEGASVVSISPTNHSNFFNPPTVSQSLISSPSINGVSGAQKSLDNSPLAVNSLPSVATVSSPCIIVSRDAQDTQSHVPRLTTPELCLSSTPPSSLPMLLTESSVRSSPVVSVVSSSTPTSTSSTANLPTAAASTPSSSSSDITRQETVHGSLSQGYSRSLTTTPAISSSTASRTVTVSVPSSSSSSAQRSVTVPAPSSSSVGGPRSLTVPAPSSAMNLTVLNSSDSKSGTSFLSPSGVVPSSANNRSAPEDGRSRCYICQKEFARSSQLSLHMNIHYMERPFRCDSCSVSFRTSGHLQKHKRSASHFNKVSMNLTFGAASTDNPRPFKCDECKIAFRIHGHLAKHLRSKMHILKLECVAKLPFGVYAEMERTGYPLANIDTTDCEHSLLSLQDLADKLFAKEPEKLVAWRKAAATLAKTKKNKDRPRTASASSCNSDEYPLADDQDDPSPLPDSGDENDNSPCSRSGGDVISSPSRSPQSPAPLSQPSSFTVPFSANSTTYSTSTTSVFIEKTDMSCSTDSLQPMSTTSIPSTASILVTSTAKSSSASPQSSSIPSILPSSPQVSSKSPLSLHASSSPSPKSRTTSLSPASVHSASA
ncbi:Zinc finger C2H2-type [Trinorchestia longiramus]|nr:Zinc finger C2H2-type [Trinorchestia longiramus]